MESLVSFSNVSKYYKDKKGNLVTAVDNVNLSVEKNQVVALVGESGSGKTTLGRMAAGLVRPSKGEVIFAGKEIQDYNPKELWKKAQYIHQDPYSSLDAYLTVKEVLDRPLRYLAGVNDAKEREVAITTFLQNIGLEHVNLNTKIKRLSGGEKQRILVSRAFILGPEFVAADEPTTMVDFIHRNEILEILMKLRKEYAASILFITHDLSLASYLADYVAIMYRGSIVEYGKADRLLKTPKHPYTQALFSVTPDRLLNSENSTQSFVQSRANLFPSGEKFCKYVNMCPFALDRCKHERPALQQIEYDRWVACYLHNSISMTKNTPSIETN